MRQIRYLQTLALAVLIAHAASTGHGQEVMSIDSSNELKPIPQGEVVEHVHGGRFGGRARGFIRKPIDDAYQFGITQYHHANLLSSTGGTAIYTDQWNKYHAQMQPWHGAYYHRDWGKPLAVVVPPTAQYQTNWSWGVGNTTSTPIYHQYGRSYPGAFPDGGGYPGGQFRATPYWPSHTSQYGAYYIRSPW